MNEGNSAMGATHLTTLEDAGPTDQSTALSRR